jgi:putative membrane protein
LVIRVLLAGLHLLGLGVGLGAVWGRARALRSRLDPAGLRSVFLADNFWGLAAALWLGTGLWRLLAGVEKDTAYYFHNHVFLGKMACFAIILALEGLPMITLIRWRRQVARGEQPDTSAAPLLARISLAQAGIVIVMVFLAAAMARGFGLSLRSH